jgi:hypothetical protein
MVQGAWAAGHSKGTFLSALFLRISRRHGMKKAAVAVAHRMLVYIFYIIRDGGSCVEKGSDFFDRQHPERTAARLIARLGALDYETSGIIRKVPSVPAPALSPEDLRPGRGRPCKCASRGIPCPHPPRLFRASPAPPPALLEARFGNKQAKQPPEGQLCRQCNRWGIACIHVKPRI